MHRIITMSCELDKIRNVENGFLYPAINAKTQIRFLRKCPEHEENGSLRYTIEVYNVSDLPSTEYAALSYTWGDAHNDQDLREITINDQIFAIRRNLFGFFETAAEKGESGLLFVDAICINQLDLAERRCQVQEVIGVYRNASNVIAWLGIPESGEELACVRSLTSPTADRKESRKWTEQQHDGFDYLSRHTYWTRVWIVQEVFLAQRIEVWCERYTFPLSLFSNDSPAARPPHMQRYSMNGRSITAAEVVRLALSPAENVVAHRTGRLAKWLSSPSFQGFGNGFFDEEPTWTTNPYMAAGTYMVYETLSKFGVQNCSDVRDKLYGFLGLLNESSRARVDPDYTKPSSYACYQALKIGLEEMNGELGSKAGPRSPFKEYTISIPYYRDVRGAFSMTQTEMIAEKGCYHV
ncbi:hypothetical protein M426DRAFT_123369 [Hypoxylon sp. CI-4A]|nr:hypothetical protein M426DRAFT_123369 [Hypoxylon sp. CI-4A]